MATLGGKSSAKNNKKVLLVIGIAIILIILILGSILLIGAFYFLLYKPSESIVTISNVSQINATSSTSSVSTSSIESTTTIIPTSTTSTSTILSTTSIISTTTQSTTTLLSDMSRIAQCFNNAGVKLYVSDACLEIARCRGIKNAFGSAFNEFTVINCDEDGSETECDTAREEHGSLGFPLWYVSLLGEYEAGKPISYIQEITGCN